MYKVVKKGCLAGKNVVCKFKRGFTLIELLVVVLIIGILAAVAVPQYKKAVIRSRVAKQIALLSDIYPAVESCFLETGNISQCTKEKLALDFDTTCPPLGSPYADDCSVSWEYQTYGNPSNYQPAIGLGVLNHYMEGSKNMANVRIIKHKNEIGCVVSGGYQADKLQDICKKLGFNNSCQSAFNSNNFGGYGGQAVLCQ